jgi:hypothetical protein
MENGSSPQAGSSPGKPSGGSGPSNSHWSGGGPAAPIAKHHPVMVLLDAVPIQSEILVMEDYPVGVITGTYEETCGRAYMEQGRRWVEVRSTFPGGRRSRRWIVEDGLAPLAAAQVEQWRMQRAAPEDD